MEEMEFSEIMAAAEAFGAGDLVRSILCCDWGWKINLPGNEERCREQATRRMVIHAPPEGPYPKEMVFQFCQPHFELVESETVPHA